MPEKMQYSESRRLAVLSNDLGSIGASTQNPARWGRLAGASRVASGLLCVHAVAISPAGSMELVRSSVSIANGLPHEIVRSAPAITFSGPAQRSLTLRPARSRSRQATLYTESSDSFVASAAAPIATGWSEPVPGREFHPLKSSAFHDALLRQLPL